MTDFTTICHHQENRLSAIAEAYLKALLAADRNTAEQVVNGALQTGLPIRDLYMEVFQPVQHEIGRLWLLNRVTVAEEHFCTAVTQAIMSELYSQIISSQRTGRTMVAACVGAELHEMGVRMVADFFEMDGWDTFYLGSGVKESVLLSAIDRYKPDLVALSATMTYHVPKVIEMITAIKGRLAEHAPHTMVGGMPFNVTWDLWRTTGADLWASDAVQAVQAANQMMEGA